MINTEIGVIRMTVTQKRRIFSRKTLKLLKRLFLLKFSQMISDGQGAYSMLQFYN